VTAQTSSSPSLWLRAGHLAALWSFAFVQPLFDLLGHNADFFVARDNGRADILIFSFALVVLPAATMIAVEALVERGSRRGAWAIHLALVALLVAAIALQALKNIASGPAALLIALALVIGGLASLAYHRTRAVRSLASFLIPAPAIFLAIFLLFSDVSELVLPQPSPAVYAATGETEAPVVMVVFDELPSSTLMDSRERINAHRFPNFADLAHHSTWYRNATTVADHTAVAVPAILTGSYPDPGALSTAADQPHSLFTLLGNSYHMNVHESVTQLCPTSICERTGVGTLPDRLAGLVSDLSLVSEHLLLPSSIARNLPPVSEGYSNFRSGGAGTGSSADVAATGLRRRGLGTNRDKILSPFLDGIRPGPATLDFMHILFPHAPWRNLPSGQAYQTESSGEEGWLTEQGDWIRDRWATDQALQQHMLATGFADHVLGAVIQRLRQVGIWNRALIVVLADHGASFQPGQSRRNVNPGNIGEIAAPPLFIKAPGQRRGRIVDRHVRTIDVLPTIADLLGVELPFHVVGRSALGGTISSRVRIRGGGGSCCVNTDLRAVERGRAKAIARNDRLFGSDTGWRAVWRIGPHANLIGRPARALPTSGRPPGQAASVMDRSLYSDIDPRGPLVPSLVRFGLAAVPAGAPLAVAVNGTIAAVTRSYNGFTGGDQGLALVPPSDFRRGTNQLDVYLVRNGHRAPPTVVRLGGT
jgi:hypothetical protein